MNDIHNILLNLISNIIWFFAGVLIVSVFYFVRVRLPRRRLWRLTNPKNLVACASNAATMDTGVYNRPATGIGELRALTLAEKSLNKAYRRELDIKNILLASDHLQERLENDLLLLGGPKHNKVTAIYLDMVDDNLPIQQTLDAIFWRCKKIAGKWVDDGFLDLENKMLQPL